MKAALYLRISQDHTGEGLGVARQLEDCKALAQQLDWEVVEVYTDNDKSATSGKPRPDYRRMLREIEAGEIEAIIAWHPDRLYRRAVDLGELVEVCKKHNIQVATVKAGTVDLTTPTGRLVAGLLAQVATYEGEAKADRWRRSIRQRREAGQPPGWGPRLFGYTRDGEIIEEEREVTEWMVQQILDGVPLHRVAHQLGDKGVRTSLGNPWQTPAIRKYLTNPRLAGFSVLNGKVVGAGTWQPLLDAEKWETVCALLSNRRRPTPRPRVALLAGMIFCGGCEAKMVTGARMNKRKETVRVYRCSRVPGTSGCGKISARAATVEEIVESYARTKLDDPRVHANIARLQAVAGSGDVAGEILTLDQRVHELEEQLGEPGIPVQTILRAIDKAKLRREDLQARLVSSVPITLPRPGEWPTDLERRRRLIGLVVAGVTIRPATTPGVFDPERVRVDPR